MEAPDRDALLAPRSERRKRAQSGRRARSPRAESSAPSVLALAVRRLVAETGATRCAAWARRPDGSPFVAAARFTEGRALVPRPAELAALAALPHAARIHARSPAALRALAERHGFAAAAPIERATSGDATAYLLAGPEASPRLVGALDAAARRAASLLAVADASARLASLDADVQHLDRLASLGDLVAEIVHEVRNPLVSVKTFLQLLPERLDDHELRTDFLDVVTDELRRIERLLDVVLDHARPPRRLRAAAEVDREERSAPLAAVLDSVTRLIAHRALQRGVRLETECADARLAAALPEDALRQIALNLALNAIDATPPEGRVHLRAGRRGTAVALIVDDQGPGVPKALRERIFEPFFSTKRERPGGLGLAITRRIVETARGAIEVGPAPGGGTRFRVRLPRARS